MKFDRKRRLPPHHEDPALSNKVNIFVDELEIIFPEHLGQDKIDFHVRKTRVQRKSVI